MSYVFIGSLGHNCFKESKWTLYSSIPQLEVPDLVSPFDGVFCPSQLDASGRFKYQSADRVLAFETWAIPGMSLVFVMDLMDLYRFAHT